MRLDPPFTQSPFFFTASMLFAAVTAAFLGLALAGCAARPSSVTAEAAAGYACFGAECGPNGEVRVSATWDLPNHTTSEVKPWQRFEHGDCVHALYDLDGGWRYCETDGGR